MIELLLSELNSRILFVYFFLILFFIFLTRQVIFRLKVNGKRIRREEYINFLKDKLPNYTPAINANQITNDNVLNQEFTSMYEHFLKIISQTDAVGSCKDEELDNLFFVIESLIKKGDRKIRQSLLKYFVESFARDIYEGKIKLPGISKYLGSATRKYFLIYSNRLIKRP